MTSFVVESLFYSTIIFAVSMICIVILKLMYINSITKINTDFRSKESSEPVLPEFNVDINSAIFWTAAVTVIIIIVSFIYDFSFNSRNFNLENENKRLNSEINICKDQAKKELLLELKSDKND